MTEQQDIANRNINEKLAIYIELDPFKIHKDSLEPTLSTMSPNKGPTCKTQKNTLRSVLYRMPYHPHCSTPKSSHRARLPVAQPVATIPAQQSTACQLPSHDSSIGRTGSTSKMCHSHQSVAPTCAYHHFIHHLFSSERPASTIFSGLFSPG